MDLTGVLDLGAGLPEREELRGSAKPSNMRVMREPMVVRTVVPTEGIVAWFIVFANLCGR